MFNVHYRLENRSKKKGNELYIQEYFIIGKLLFKKQIYNSLFYSFLSTLIYTVLNR